MEWFSESSILWSISINASRPLYQIKALTDQNHRPIWNFGISSCMVSLRNKMWTSCTNSPFSYLIYFLTPHCFFYLFSDLFVWTIGDPLIMRRNCFPKIMLNSFSRVWVSSVLFCSLSSGWSRRIRTEYCFAEFHWLEDKLHFTSLSVLQFIRLSQLDGFQDPSLSTFQNYILELVWLLFLALLWMEISEMEDL